MNSDVRCFPKSLCMCVFVTVCVYAGNVSTYGWLHVLRRLSKYLNNPV